MRHHLPLLALTLLACSDEPHLYGPPPADGGSDAATLDVDASVPDASIDAALVPDAAPEAGEPDAAPVDAAVVDASLDAGFDAGQEPDACRPNVLLRGGEDVAAQGWMSAAMGANTLTYEGDFTRITTTTPSGSPTSGQHLLYLPNVLVPPFKVELVLRVESVSPHNAFDAAAAIMGSFTPPAGAGLDRSRMVYLDSAAVGWADESQSAAASVVDGVNHTFVFSVDAQNTARLTVDGVAKLMRTDYATNGTLAVGDQTNDPNVDATLRIYSVTLLCP